MIDKKLACEFILAYDVLTDRDRAIFERTPAGCILKAAVSILEDYDKKGFFEWLISESREAIVNETKQKCMSHLSTNNDYQHLLRQIHFKHVLIQINATYHTKESTRLAKLYFPHLKIACENQIFVMNLDEFNQKQAEDLAKNALRISPLPISSWLDLYQQSLLKYIENNLGLINNKDPLKEALTYSEIKDSLSYLLSYGVVKEGKDFFDQMADAHGFIQAIGFSTQNESSYMSLIDVYNYFRFKKPISEAKFTASRFLQPFAPLFAEYHNITHREHNILRQVIRTLIPMLIVAAVVILVAALLTQFIIPELAFIIILIPTLYVALMLATIYVSTKDHIYHTLRAQWHGGQFKIPEFQVNERMELGFQDRRKANVVRQFYVDALRLCYEKETLYQQKTEGTLSNAEVCDRTENNVRISKLNFEWYDIHCNTKMGYNDISKIVLHRLRLDIKEHCKFIQKELPGQLKKEILKLVTKITDELKTSIKDIPLQTATAPAARTSQHGFFKQPSCFEHKIEMERLNAMATDLESESANLNPNGGMV